MKFQNQSILEFDGRPVIKDSQTKDVLTVKDAILSVVQLETNENRLTAEQKNAAFQIGIKVVNATDIIELTVEQVGFIKERSGLFNHVIVHGRLCEILEKPVAEEIKQEEPK